MKTKYLDWTELMLRVLPSVAKEPCFALRGGTAINFFLRDMPRLSVDIDLVYVPIEVRKQSLEHIGEALKHIRDVVKWTLRGVSVREEFMEGTLYKLFVQSPRGTVKIEPNLTFRGTVYPTEERTLCVRAQERFGFSIKMPIVSVPDLFGGKICAALDRQHPRDLYDIKSLLENEGLTPEIRKAFVVYWVSHDRPMHELIEPIHKDFKRFFENEFADMTNEPIKYEDLIETREKLIELLKCELSDEERRFVVSVKEGNPKWSLLGIEGLEKLPAIQWKLQNIAKMEPKKHQEHLRKLKEKLGLE